MALNNKKLILRLVFDSQETNIYVPLDLLLTESEEETLMILREKAMTYSIEDIYKP